MAAYTTIDNPGGYFNVVKWSGDGTSPRTISGVGFAPGLTILKARDSAQYWYTYDSVRGAGVSKEIHLDMNEAEGAAGGTTGYLSAFNSDGFVVTAGTSNDNVTNDGALTYCSWNWKAGTTSGISGGDISPSGYSIDTTSKFGTYQYAGSGTDGDTIAHGLGAAPQMIIIKSTSNTTDWEVGHHMLNVGTNPWQYQLFLNTNAAQRDDTGFSDTAPSSTLVTLGNVTNINNSGKTYVMYAFAGVQGFSKFGVYEGNGNADGTFIYLGFRPAMVIFKKTSGSNVWMLMDNERSSYNVMNEYLKPDLANAENNDEDVCDFLSNGVKLRASNGKYNESGSDYIYAAFAEAPLVNSSGVPNNAR